MDSNPAWAKQALNPQEEPFLHLFKTGSHFSPQLKSYQYQLQAIQNEIQALKYDRWININANTKNIVTSSTNSANMALQSGAQLSNTFDIANKKGIDIRIKQYEYLVGLENYQIALKNYLIKLAQHYFDALYYRELNLLQYKNLLWVKEQTKRVEMGVKMGGFAKIDLARLKVTSMGLESIARQTLLNEKKSLQMIEQMTGVTLKKTNTVFNAPLHVIKEEQFLDFAPEIKKMEQQHAVLKTKIEKESHNWWPDLIVSANNYYLLQPSNTGVINSIQMSLNFQASGGRLHRIEAQRKKLQSLEQKYAYQHLTLKSDFRQRMMALNTFYQNRKTLESAAQLAEQNRQQLEIGYMKHFVNLNNLIAGNQEWLQVKSKHIQNKFEYLKPTRILYYLTQGDIYHEAK